MPQVGSRKLFWSKIPKIRSTEGSIEFLIIRETDGI
jgi:hypothetical protein